MKKFSSKQAGILNQSDLKTKKGKALYWTMFTILVAVCIITLFPVLWMVLTAFKSSQEMYSSVSLIPENFSFSGASEHIADSWDKLKLGRSMINTLIVSIGNVIVNIFVCGLAGYVLSKFKVRGTKLVFTLVIWTMMMPSIVRTVPTYMSYISFPFIIDDGVNSVTNMNILNTYWPIWIGSAANSFNIILFKNNFDTISTSIMEAAMIDGCSNFKIFTRIMLPIALPVVVYVSIGALSSAWADYFTPYIVLKDAELMTTPAKVFMMKNDKGITANIYMMGLMFASIPSFIIFCVFQKWIMGGISLGGVKG
ncbi:MAG: carbohydrate ABC transporter permease [Ruminococcaceae bacterium]|nr:carbohydrate ABC transporter permease [Oscillospiraceae bacterium]